MTKSVGPRYAQFWDIRTYLEAFLVFECELVYFRTLAQTMRGLRP
jgi:hypothetical protein